MDGKSVLPASRTSSKNSDRLDWGTSRALSEQDDSWSRLEPQRCKFLSLSRTGEVCGLRNASVEREYGNQPTNEFEEFLPVDLYNFETEDNDDGFGGLRSFELRF